MFVSDRKLSKWECFLTLAPIFYNGTSKCGLSETDVRQQGEAEFDEYKKRSESTRSAIRNRFCANRHRIQTALEYVTFAIPDTTGVVKEKRFEIDFWSHRYWVRKDCKIAVGELNQSQGRKTTNWKNWDYAVFKISVRWKMFCALVQWLCYAQLKLKSKKYGRRRNQRRKPKQKEISKSNTQKSQ